MLTASFRLCARQGSTCRRRYLSSASRLSSHSVAADPAFLQKKRSDPEVLLPNDNRGNLSLKDADPEMHALLEKELTRQVWFHLGSFIILEIHFVSLLPRCVESS